MEYTWSQKADIALEMRMVKRVYEALEPGNRGPYPFTRTAIDIHLEDMPEDAKHWACRKILDVMDGFCRRNDDKLHTIEKRLIKDKTDYLKKNIEQDGMRAAVNDIFYMENVYLKNIEKQLSEIEAPDVKSRLIEKMFDQFIMISDIGAKA